MAHDERAVHRALASPSRAGILDALRRTGRALDTGEIAGQVGQSANSVRLHLAVLSEAGLVQVERRPAAGRGRPAAVYRAAERPAPESPEAPEEYRLLAEILAGSLATTATEGRDQAADAGERWGRYLADRPAPFEAVAAAGAAERATDLLRRLHFRPELRLEEGGARILVHHCPFRSVAERFPAVACSVHLGLIRGALEASGAPLQVLDLQPFVEPDLCVAQLGPRRAD
jgi:predicted ArsR family transcriptional regulator